MNDFWRGRTTGDPDGNWTVSDSGGRGGPRPRHHPDDTAAQHARRVARFGPEVVAEMEAKINAMAATDAGLSRENVLSLMEGMFSHGLDVRTGGERTVRPTQFYRTTITIHRPYSGLTPLGITRIVIEAETEATSAEEAKQAALTAASHLDISELDHVTKVDTEVR